MDPATLTSEQAMRDVQAYGLCWCGEPRRFRIEGWLEGPDVHVRTALVCYVGHDADDGRT